jgi:hypothetical protein
MPRSYLARTLHLPFPRESGIFYGLMPLHIGFRWRSNVSLIGVVNQSEVGLSILDVLGRTLEACLVNKGFAVGPSAAIGVHKESKEQRHQRKLAETAGGRIAASKGTSTTIACQTPTTQRRAQEEV